MQKRLRRFERIIAAASIAVLLTGAQRAPSPTPPPAALAEADAGRAEALRLIDVWLDAQQAYDRLPALSVAVVQGEEPIWSRGYGFVDVEQQFPATGQTLYSICSISKLFTSIGVMQQWEAGRVSLDAPITEYLPWATLAAAEGPTVDSVPITMRGLLTHSAGMPRESDVPYWSGPDFPFPTQDQIRETYPRQTPLFAASRWYQYSNLGLTLAGEAVEAVSGQTYADYMQARILDPLGLSDTHTRLPVELMGTRLAVAWGPLNRQGRREPLPPFDTRGVLPAAGFTSTVEDLGRFAAWQLRLLRTGREEVLQASTLREMQRVHFTSPDWQVTRGLGFGVRRIANQTYVGHSGSCPGYQTSLLLRPASETAVSVMLTGVQSTGPYSEGIFAVLDKRKGFKFETPASIDLTPYVGRYQDGVWGSEAAILPWAGGLVVIDLPSVRPADSLLFLKPKGENRFMAIRDDGSESDEVRFDRGADGSVSALTRFSNPMRRTAGL